jgi:hypothetical protein
MCWLDKKSIKQILSIRDLFSISTFVETGAFKGVNARFHSQNFSTVLTCDISDEYLTEARNRLKGCANVVIYKQSSPDFLRSFIQKYQDDGRKDTVFIYLDAHFYDPSLPPDEKWVVINELKALEGFKNCVICIHDFDCEGLGHCRYDGEPLSWLLIRDYIMKVNPDFHYYTNAKESCEIYDEKTIRGVPGILMDEVTIDNIRYAHSEERLTYRGILYASPGKLDLTAFELKELVVE